MIRKKISKSLTVISVISLITSFSCIPVLADTLMPEKSDFSSDGLSNRISDDFSDMPSTEKQLKKIVNSDLFKEKTITLTKEFIKDDNPNIKIEKVKKAQDFAGNTYTIVECLPIGYYILHDETGQYIEYSDESPSPYSNYDKNLFYVGPMEYYVNDNEKYIHTLDSSTIAMKEDIKEVRMISEEIDERLNQKQNKAVVDFLLNKDSVLKANSTLTAKKAVSKASAAAATYWASNSSIISRQNYNFGFIDGGCCGYIAANILLRYWKSRGKINFSYSNVVQLTKDLLNEGKKFGYGYLSWGGSIANVINSFAKTKRFKAAAGSGIGGNYAFREIKNGKRPSILFGSLNRPSGSGKVKHAVVAYGVKVPKDTFNNFNTYICHYGWNGYAKVNISGALIGSCTSYSP